jgi:hypothetical protein
MLRQLGKWLRLGSLERGDFTSASHRPVENVDALAAAGQHGDRQGSDQLGRAAYPPGYVKPYDEGRPRH